MPITALELTKKINATQNDWVSVSGNVTESPLDSGIEPFWQFRVAIKPTRANAIKAVNALASLPQFKETFHPEFKVFMPAENGDLNTWDPTINGGDRDQRGKEICVYMAHLAGRKKPDYYEGNYPSQDYLKSLMLDMWKALQDAGVELAYITPAVGEKKVPCDNVILTPFSYSSFKPYKQRHGILLEKSYNPTGQENPLNGVVIFAEDLQSQGIHPMGALKSAQRLIFQMDHYYQRKQRVDQQYVKLLNAPNSNQPDRRILSSERFIEYKSFKNRLLNINESLTKSDESVESIKKQIVEICKYGEQYEDLISLPSEASLNDKLLSRHLPILTSLARERHTDDINIRNKYFKLLSDDIVKSIENNKVTGEPIYKKVVHELIKDILNRFEVERNLSVTEIMNVLDVKPSQEKLMDAFRFYPQQFQEVYQKMVHLNNEKATIFNEASLFQNFEKPEKFPESYREMHLSGSDPLDSARIILNDYTKGNSLMSRLIHGHWNRHHVEEIDSIVKDIDSQIIANMSELSIRLAAIHLQNPKGSLAKRMEFIVLPYAESMRQEFVSDFGIAESATHSM